jgi:methionine-rich copper-binding protein CopC
MLIRAIAISILAAGWPAAAGAHAFLDHAEPGVGATVAAAPAKIVLHFDSELELAFSGFRVEDESGKQVCASEPAERNPDSTLLFTASRLPGPGTYKIVYSVLARDGHRTEGDFELTIEP